MTLTISKHRLCRAIVDTILLEHGKQKDVTYILYNNLPHPPLTYLLMLSHSL